MVMECETGKIINVYDARFGRFDSETCKDESSEISTDWTCETPSGALEIVKDRF